ncbi:MAG: DUF456 domain-containing protein [Flavobacteriales bacterium]|nr:DUF456 domain-containing protein [Flavobacteriales bacterium]
MIEWLMIITGAILCLVGVLGSFLPVIPGPPLSFAAILFLHFSHIHNRLSITFIVIILIITFLLTLLDYLIPIWGTKKFGGSKYGVWGSTIGLVIGLFFGPLGIVFGPFLGALLGELFGGRNTIDSLRSAWGSFVGFIFSTGLKLLFTLFVATVYFTRVIQQIGDMV